MAAGEDPTERSAEQSDTASDEILARRVQAGDAAALERLVRRYVRRVHAVAASYLPEPADVEDVAQETFLRAIRAIGAYDPERAFAPWLYQIARNVARNHVTSRARWTGETPSPTLPSPLPGPEVLVERAEVRDRMTLALAKLPEQQRTAFRFCDVEGYTMEEVAGMMGLAPGTVRSHLHHARRALRIALAKIAERAEHGGG